MLDRHLLQVGIEHEAFDLYNLFVPSSAGRFLFSVYEGLTSRVARVDYVNTKSNVATDGAATWGFTKQVFTFEDNYQLSDNIEVDRRHSLRAIFAKRPSHVQQHDRG